MKCPHCEKEIPGQACPICGATIPAEGSFCMYCGAYLKGDAEDAATAREGLEPEGEELDFESRVLCPDGACTGIIVNGRCTECGRTVAEAQNASQEG